MDELETKRKELAELRMKLDGLKKLQLEAKKSVDGGALDQRTIEILLLMRTEEAALLTSEVSKMEAVRTKSDSSSAKKKQRQVVVI
jgi:hypothetical protein